MKNFLLLGAAILALAACAKVDLLNAWVPHSGYTLHRDIAYGSEPRQKLDIYVPDNAPTDAPVIVFFYGGSWQQGAKADYRFAGQALASKGYVTVIADYRLYPEVYFPTFMEDAAKAVQWTHEHIGEYGGDAKKLFLAGHSAGAYIAVMLTLNEQYLRAQGGKRSWIKGTIGMAGPYDFLPFTSPNIKALFSKQADFDTQPINFVGPHMPPMLLLTGDEDTDVYPKNTRHLAEKLRKAGNHVTEKIYPGVAHIGIILALAEGFRDKAPTLFDIDTFIKEIDRGGPTH
jgi:acetyl esterase/lipase